MLSQASLHTHPVPVLEMFLIVSSHAQAETLLVLNSPHEAQVSGLGDCSLTMRPGPAERLVSGQKIVSSLVHQHQGSVRVQ